MAITSADPAVEVWQYYADWANDRQLQRSKPRFGNARLQQGSDT